MDPDDGNYSLNSRVFGATRKLGQGPQGPKHNASMPYQMLFALVCSASFSIVHAKVSEFEVRATEA